MLKHRHRNSSVRQRGPFSPPHDKEEARRPLRELGAHSGGWWNIWLRREEGKRRGEKAGPGATTSLMLPSCGTRRQRLPETKQTSPEPVIGATSGVPLQGAEKRVTGSDKEILDEAPRVNVSQGNGKHTTGISIRGSKQGHLQGPTDFQETKCQVLNKHPILLVPKDMIIISHPWANSRRKETMKDGKGEVDYKEREKASLSLSSLLRLQACKGWGGRPSG